MPTLDDLAAQLAALGWTVIDVCGTRIELIGPRGQGRVVAYDAGIGPDFHGELNDAGWHALDLIRAWKQSRQQSGARPEPVGAERVRLELSREDAVMLRDLARNGVKHIVDYRGFPQEIVKEGRRVVALVQAALAGETK